MTQTSIPSIPNVTRNPADLEKALKAVKEIIQVREGRLGDIQDAFVSYRDLVNHIQSDSDVAAALASAVRLYDINDSNFLSLTWNEDDTSDRILNLLVHGATRTIDLYENLKILDGQNIELHASGGEKAQLAIDTQNAERTLDLSENLTLADGYNFTLQALGQANSLILNESLTLGNGYDGTLTFSAASKVLTVDESASMSDFVREADYGIQTILRATTNNTPTALTVTEQTLVGRITSGNIAALSTTQIRTLINVEDGSTADQTGAEIATAISGQTVTALTVTTLTSDSVDGVDVSILATAYGNHAAAANPHSGHALESVLGTSIGAGLTLDGAVLKASSVLQKYHAIDPTADVQSLLGCADEAAIRTLLDLEAGTDFYSKSAEDTWRNSVSQTEMGYVDGVTSDIQTQFGAKASKTTGAWSKTIGTNGQDYADWATMIDAMPDLIAHAVTVTIKAGTTLTEICDIENKHGVTVLGTITIQAEKYFPPTSGDIPTADSATATTLRDAALATAAKGDDYFNGCWILVCDGTGTDNGFVLITDYTDATGDVHVDAWPGTEPDNTSRYIIVGALIDAEAARSRGFRIMYDSALITLTGIGIKNSDSMGVYVSYCSYVSLLCCGVHGSDTGGVWSAVSLQTELIRCGIVENNTDNNSHYAGVAFVNTLCGRAYKCAFSDNNKYGVLAQEGGYAYINENFGDGNGDWGAYARRSGQLRITGAEASGSSGNHSDAGTANAAADDQAAAYGD